ncbi:hypothetical protein EVA_04350 [gut metagenome]|uniref:Uncharacterized protein n=1 Tax=gut metagenome TaxID=749906 RepID=J9GJV8_9ZZZZ
MNVELEVTEKEFDGILDNFDEEEVIDHFGTRRLLPCMDKTEIIDYLKEKRMRYFRNAMATKPCVA